MAVVRGQGEATADLDLSARPSLAPTSKSVSQQLVSVNAVHRSAPTDLVELARQVETANTFVRAAAHNKLQQIAEQIRFLQQQARAVLETAVHDNSVHNAGCNFQKRPGHIYHLYRKSDGTKFMSMLSPEEWGKSCPNEFLGSYRLEFDMSWTPVDKLKQRDEDMALIDRFLMQAPSSSASAATELARITDS